MAANPWFRMYHEFATDPKVQMLSESDQRRYIMLLCLRCSGEGETLHDDRVAFQLRISDDEWQSTKATLIERGLIDDDCLPIGWDKRQYVSDSSTARVKRFRDKKKRERNVSVTPPESEADTESDTDLKKENTLAAVAAPAAPAEKPEREKVAISQAQLVSLGVNPQHAKDWIAARKAKRLPLTQTALDIVVREAAKLNWALPQAIAHAAGIGWAGFKAQWVLNDQLKDKAGAASAGGQQRQINPSGKVNYTSNAYNNGITDDGRF